MPKSFNADDSNTASILVCPARNWQRGTPPVLPNQSIGCRLCRATQPCGLPILPGPRHFCVTTYARHLGTRLVSMRCKIAAVHSKLAEPYPIRYGRKVRRPAECVPISRASRSCKSIDDGADGTRGPRRDIAQFIRVDGFGQVIDCAQLDSHYGGREIVKCGKNDRPRSWMAA